MESRDREGREVNGMDWGWVGINVTDLGWVRCVLEHLKLSSFTLSCLLWHSEADIMMGSVAVYIFVV